MVEAYVSFETAKLLKEKGFNEKTYRCYNLCTEEHELSDIDSIALNNYELDGDGVVAPTHQMAMAWLREVHNILIIIDVRSGIEQESIYCWQLEDKHTGDYIGDIIGECSLYEEAADSAIKYCLENLI